MIRASEGTQYWGGGAEGILCGVMKLKNPIVVKSRSLDTCSPRKILKFSPFKIAFWVILHQTDVIITHLIATECSWQLQALCVNAHWDEVECICL